MIRRHFIAPPHLQFFISDENLPDAPIQGEHVKIISNGKCLSVPCRYWEEGKTELVIGGAQDITEESRPRFEGTIPTPSRKVVFSDSGLTRLLTVPVESETTHVTIWTDGSLLPSRIVIALDK